VRNIRLHVIADDFGTCAAVDEGILKCRREGILTGASIAVNGDTASAAVGEAPTVALNLGVHINLVDGKPISPPDAIISLLDGNGRFRGTSARFFERYWRGKMDSAHIRREAEAQIEWLLQRGIHPTHIDSHQHIHLWHSLLPLFLELAKKYDIKHIRLPSLPLEPANGNIGRWFKYSALCYLGAMGRAKAAHAGLSVADRLWGLMVTGEMDRDYLLRMLHSLPAGNHELLCHPSVQSEDCGGELWCHRGWEETAALTDPQVKEAIARRGIVLER
jgi:chitin disaccharide deacetylase